MQPNHDDDDDELLQLVKALETSTLRPELLTDASARSTSVSGDEFDDLVTDPDALRRLLGLR